MPNQPSLIGPDHIERSVEIMRMFEPPEGYYLAFSGGRDSTVLLEVAKLAGVRYDAHYNVTGIDPPELVRHIRQHFPEVAFERPGISWWKGIEKNGLPQRNARWCCRQLKERGGSGRTLLIGVRAAESSKRSKYGILRHCQRYGKDMVSPLLAWSDDQVWGFIRSRGLPYCCLYDQGWRRIGCIPCPFESRDRTEVSIARWPRLFAATRKAAKRYWDRLPDPKNSGGPNTRFVTFDEYWSWWLRRERNWPGRIDEEPDQGSLFGPE